MRAGDRVTSDTAADPGVQSVRRAAAVLLTFAPEHPFLGVAEIAERTGLNRTTAHRLVNTLESSGLIHRDPFTKKYGLSARVLRLSEVFLQQSDIRAAAMPRMTALRDLINETVALHLREDWSRIVVAQVPAHRDVRHMYRNIGEPIPLHLGAPGKAILAHLSADEIDGYLARVPLIGATPHSITDPSALRQDLRPIAQNGYAVSWEERRIGVVAMAAPIFDSHGAAFASVNVSGPSQRIRKPQVREIIPALVRTARQISYALGHVDSEPTQSL